MPLTCAKSVQVCGGTFRYSHDDGRWAPGPPLVQPRYSAAPCTYGSQLFICGGQDAANVLADVEALDTERGWLLQPPMLTARKYHGAACVHRCALTLM